MLDDIVGVELPVSMSGTYYGNPESTVPHKPFVFLAAAKAPCQWQSNSPVTINLKRFQTLGSPPVESTSMSITYDNLYYRALGMFVDRARLRIFDGRRYLLKFNAAVGDAPTAILGVPRSVLYMPDVSGGNYGATSYNTSIQEQASGVPVVDPALSRGNPVGTPTRGPWLDLFYRRSILDPAGNFANRIHIEKGRSTASAVIIETRLLFEDGEWIVRVTPHITADASIRHFYARDAFGTGDFSGAIGDTACYPMVSEPELGTFTGDLAEWSNEDPEKGVYARIRNLTATGNPALPDGLVNDGDTIEIEPEFLDSLDIFYSTFPHVYPAYLGSVTLTWPLAAWTYSPWMGFVSGYQDGSDRWDRLFYNSWDIGALDTNTNAFIQVYTGLASGFSATMTPVDISNFRSPEDPVEVALTPDSPVTAEATGDGLRWTETAGVAVAYASAPLTAVQISTEAGGSDPVLIRDVL
jgi:hypothetical protein